MFAVEMLRALDAEERVAKVNFIPSEAALRVFAEELQVSGRNGLVEKLLGASSSKIEQHPEADIGANVASGSYRSDGMIVLPCSMGTLAGIAHGLAANAPRSIYGLNGAKRGTAITDALARRLSPSR